MDILEMPRKLDEQMGKTAASLLYEDLQLSAADVESVLCLAMKYYSETHARGMDMEFLRKLSADNFDWISTWLRRPDRMSRRNLVIGFCALRLWSHAVISATGVENEEWLSRYLGEGHLNTGNYSEAIRMFEMEQDEDRRAACLAVACRANGDLVRTIELYEGILKSASPWRDYDSALLHIGEAYLCNANYKSALELYTRQIENPSRYGGKLYYRFKPPPGR